MLQQLLPGRLAGARINTKPSPPQAAWRAPRARALAAVVQRERTVHRPILEPILYFAHAVPPLARPPDIALAAHPRAGARAGFQRCGISGVELGEDEAHLRDWLAEGLYGSMAWMARHGDKRSRPPN
jgi:hypothetical protein